jgi:hypothetical protein
MAEKARFAILLPEGAISPDAFFIAERQPHNILKDCLLVIHETTQREITVHRSRLIPINDAGLQVLESKHSVCLKCGHVEGVVLDRVFCPEHHGINCGLLEQANRD